MLSFKIMGESYKEKMAILIYTTRLGLGTESIQIFINTQMCQNQFF